MGNGMLNTNNLPQWTF